MQVQTLLGIRMQQGRFATSQIFDFLFVHLFLDAVLADQYQERAALSRVVQDL